MNPLASIAQNYYRDYLPGQYASISDPQEFFGRLGQRLEDDVTRLALGLAGLYVPTETYLQKVGRLKRGPRPGERVGAGGAGCKEGRALWLPLSESR